MSSWQAPMCMWCKHFHQPPRGTGAPSCEAFPDGIPIEILRSQVLHNRPVDGDNGIQYEQAEGREPSVFVKFLLQLPIDEMPT